MPKAKRVAGVGVEEIGQWAFFAAIILAILLGLVPEVFPAVGVATVLIVLGVIIGFINITARETSAFLIAAIALLLAGTAGLENLPVIGEFIGPILLNIATFVAPAAIIVALKAIVELAKKK